MIRLTYISRAVKGVNPLEIEKMLNTARENNRKNGITGMLIFNQNFFLQIIEGSRVRVNELLKKLINDKKHYDLQIIEAIEVDERNWYLTPMEYAIPTPQNENQFIRFSTGADFNPYQMNASSIEKLAYNLSRAHTFEDNESIKRER